MMTKCRPSYESDFSCPFPQSSNKPQNWCHDPEINDAYLCLSLKGDNNRYQVQLTYESGTTQDLSVEAGELVQFLEESENGHW